MHALIWGSSATYAHALTKLFLVSGLRVETCSSREECLRLAFTRPFTAIILSRLAPEDMVRFYVDWEKEAGKGLLIIITTDTSLLVRKYFLGMGVNRYYIEPCSYSSIAQDIHKHSSLTHTIPDQIITTTYFEIDLLRRSAFCFGEWLDLTKTEFELLLFLARRRGIVLSRLELWEEVRGYEEYPNGNTIDVHVNRLRRKLPAAGRKLIKAVYGIGYRMIAEA